MDIKALPQPVQQLAKLDFIENPAKQPDYLALGITREHIPALVEVSQKSQEIWDEVGDVDEPDYWLPVHAWNALGELGALDALPTLLDLLRMIAEDDDTASDIVQEHMPEAFKRFDLPALPALAAYLLDLDNEMWSRLATAESVTGIAKKHPEVRDEVVRVLMDALGHYEVERDEFNGLIIGQLADLKVVEAAPLVERVYQADKVEQFIIGDFEDFQVDVGLLQERITPRSMPALAAGNFGAPGASPSHGKEDPRVKKKRKQAAKSRKKNRKKKK